LASANLGKVIEKIVSKVKREEEQPTETAQPGAPAIPIPEPTPTPPALPPKTVYLKSSTLNSLEELDKVKGELESGNIVMIRLTPLFDKDLDDAKRAVRNLTKFTEEINGDIASLGEDRIVVTPSNVKIWKEGITESQ
jgi:SepF-like predicted cell division protein (DUF552 family)